MISKAKIIYSIVFIVGFASGMIVYRTIALPAYKAQIFNLQKQVIEKDHTIIQLAKIERYAITNEFDKIKNQKGEKIVLDFNNTLTHNETDSVKVDTTKTESKKKWFISRWFGRK